jgi:hypothetical protein
LKNENGIYFPGKEKEGIEKLSKKIQQEMDSYKKEPIFISVEDPLMMCQKIWIKSLVY